MKPDTMTKADFVTSIILLAFSIALTVESWRMPRLEEQSINPWSAPGVVPGFLGVVLTLLALWLLGRSIVRRGFALGWSGDNIRTSLFNPGMFRFMVSLVLCVVYGGALLGRVWYPLATFLFVWAFVAVFEWDPELSQGRRGRMLLLSGLLALVASAVVSLLFEKAFLVTLP